MCIFNLSSCPSGFSPVVTNGMNWIEVQTNSCDAPYVCFRNYNYDSVVDCNSGTICTTPDLAFGNQLVPTCLYNDPWCGPDEIGCDYAHPQLTCTGIITKIGCQ